MYDDVIVLEKEIATVDDYGSLIFNKKQKEVFAQVKSVKQSEFYQAQASGYKPECTFVIADYYDYEGEQKIIYDEEEYKVIRTYRTGQQLEIVVSKGVDSIVDT